MYKCCHLTRLHVLHGDAFLPCVVLYSTAAGFVLGSFVSKEFYSHSQSEENKRTNEHDQNKK
jgi:hypothetical protein